MKVLIALNAAWNLMNFRAALIRALVDDGHQVLAVAPYDRHAEQLAELGCRYIPLRMDTQGTNPARDAALFFRFLRLFRSERPDVYLGYTVKPNIYGSLAAHTLRIPVINNVAGLGAVFIAPSWVTRLVKLMYRRALRRSFAVLFQNPDDQDLFEREGLVPPGIVDRVPGSGIDLERFAIAPFPAGETVRFLLVARMLRDKGVVEFVEAARVLKDVFPKAEFALLGFVDWQNPTAISGREIASWVSDGWVSYLGESDDVRPEIAASDCVVLPSYREGTPRTLLEAAAMGRPLVASDAVGCREVVDDGQTGFLCAVRDAGDLADKLRLVLEMPREQRVAMGRRGRRKMEREFDERIVIDKYRSLLTRLADKAADCAAG